MSRTEHNPAQPSTAQKEVRLPDLGEGLTEATIVRWLVAPGDVVTEDQVVAEVETAKATVELPCPFAGTVTSRHAEEGDEIEVGAVVLTVDQDAPAAPGGGEETGRGGHTTATDDAAPADETAPAEDAGSQTAGQREGDDGDDGDGGRLLVGYGATGGRARRRRVRTTHHPAPVRSGRPRAKPPVRKLAKDLGVDLAQITGSGPDGRITRDDVRAAAEAAATAGAAAGQDRAASPQRGPAEAGVRRVPVTGVRARIADNLTVAWREIPAAACWLTCDATGLLAARETLARAHPDVKITPLALLLRCVVVSLGDYPQLNASFDAEARELVEHEAVHLGVATQTDRGLVVPVIRDAQRRSVLDLAGQIAQLAEGARANRLAPSQLVGGTFTVSNFGAFGVDGGTPIINHPQAAILGVGKIAPQPWVVDRQLEVRDVVQLSLTFDHRVCDGAEAAGFLRRLSELVARPELLLAY